MQPSQFAHLMVDCETLSTNPYATLLSIGAVPFVYSDNDGTVLDEFTFYNVVKAHGQNRHVSVETAKWWDKQPPEAQREVFSNPYAVDLQAALLGLRHFALVHNCMYIWSYGASADIVWLRTAYEEHGIEFPFIYRDERCLRTLAAIADCPKPEPWEGFIEHHALHDARLQAYWALDCLRKIRE